MDNLKEILDDIILSFEFDINFLGSTEIKYSNPPHTLEARLFTLLDHLNSSLDMLKDLRKVLKDDQ